MNEDLFTGKGTLYAQYRPTYPPALFEYLYTKAGLSAAMQVADIGSGTGILTKLLLERGNPVFAVEPNGDMRAIAEAELRVFEGYISVNGTAEHTGLPDQSVEYVTAAQAFHWFDQPKFKEECGRILKPGGKVALLWNNREESSEIIRKNAEINRTYCKAFHGFSGGRTAENEQSEFPAFFRGAYETTSFRNDLSVDLEGFIGRNRSASYALTETDPDFDAYIGELTQLFEQYSRDGMLTIPNLTSCYVGTV